jgi:hypothetical protein
MAEIASFHKQDSEKNRFAKEVSIQKYQKIVICGNSH